MNVFVEGRGHCKVILPPAYHKHERKLLETLHAAQRADPENLVDDKLFASFPSPAWEWLNKSTLY